jgi:hypothetical protein
LGGSGASARIWARYVLVSPLKPPGPHPGSMLNSNDNNENKATKAMKQLKTRNHHKSTSSKNQTKWPKQYGEGRKDKEIVEDGLY